MQIWTEGIRVQIKYLLQWFWLNPPRKGFGEFFPTCTYPPLGHSSYESRQKEKKIEPGFHCRLTLDQHCLNLLPLLHPGPGDG